MSSFPIRRVVRLQGRIAAQGSYEEVQQHAGMVELLSEFNSTGKRDAVVLGSASSGDADVEDSDADVPEVHFEFHTPAFWL